MKVFKFHRWRLCFATSKYFIKITLKPIVRRKQTRKELNVSRSKYDLKNLVACPHRYFSFNTNILRVSVTQYHENAHIPIGMLGKEILINKIFKDYRILRSKFLDVDWREMFEDHCLNILETRFSDIFTMCKETLSGKRYKNTGLHGDLNPNNVLVDGRNMLIIDWENARPTGDFIWDIYWYNAILYRTSKNPGPDVISLLKVSSHIIKDKFEFAITYSAMKYHLDIERHRRGKDKALSDLIKRLEVVNSFYI